MTGATVKLLLGLPLLFVLLFRSTSGNSTYYSSFYGTKISSSQYALYVANSTAANCTNTIEKCNSTEARRIDGTCNNLNHPSYGATRTPYIRLLDAEYNLTSSTVFDSRLSQAGTALPLARDLRLLAYAEGVVEDDVFTTYITHMAVFFATDITNTRDTTNYVTWRPYCCQEAGKSDPMCAPNAVSPIDRVHRYSGITCLNMTRPVTFQTSGCLANTTTPLRIVDATPLFDLSPVYGNVIETARRNYTGGLLNTVLRNGRSFPPTTGISLLLGVNFFGIIFFWRYHNFLAVELAKVNPCWDDEKLFNTAREINIAVGCQILYYELMANLMGYDKLVADDIISEDSSFRDPYTKAKPQVSLEFPVALRWMHGMQDGAMNMYYTNGTYNSSYPIVNLTSNINFLYEGDNIVGITQACFRQPTAKINDFIADPDIVNNGLGRLQKTNDIMTNDLAKNRLFGFKSYIKYREYCFGDNITSFDDLIGIVNSEKLYQMKQKYKHVADIDVLFGMWVEEVPSDSYVPPMVYCLVSDQLRRNIQSDRHWYERETRPNAFTSDQLAEIRNITAARILCDIGDSVTEIQPKSFLVAGTDNEIVSCDEITQMDFTAWADDDCSTDTTTVEENTITE